MKTVMPSVVAKGTSFAYTNSCVRSAGVTKAADNSWRKAAACVLDAAGNRGSSISLRKQRLAPSRVANVRKVGDMSVLEDILLETVGRTNAVIRSKNSTISRHVEPK